MIRKFCSKSIVLLSVMFVLFFAGNASATNITTNATVVTAVTVLEVTPLDFGSFVAPVLAETITLDTTGVLTPGIISHLGGHNVGEASVAGHAIGDTVHVIVTGGTLTGSLGGNMTVRINCQGPVGVAGTVETFCDFTSTLGGTEIVTIGGELDVNAGQTSGVYTGNVTVTAGYY